MLFLFEAVGAVRLGLGLGGSEKKEINKEAVFDDYVP